MTVQSPPQTEPSQQPRQQQQPQQQNAHRIAIEPEPRVLCGLPIGGAVGILGSILMICQIFGLLYLSPFMLYFFEISIGSAMMFILSTGAKHKKIAYITAYMLYISMYTFWVFFLILGAILATVYLVDNNDNICKREISEASSTAKGCIPEKFTTGDVEMVVISCFFLTVSIVVALVQMRYLMLLYNYLRRNAHRLPSHLANNMNVQYIVPTPMSPSGMPPPPRYTAYPAPIPTQPGPTTKPPLSLENESTASRNGSVGSTPILTISPIHQAGTDNLGFGDNLPDSDIPARPPAYSDVVEPGHITVRNDALS
uniref:MARVEL domain-containing protein n=1 Tax=Caenorhabditis tropicalis TaxID=1561998 RepID=A0A1I7UL62_9PELO